MIRPILVGLSCAGLLVLTIPTTASEVGVRMQFSDLEVAAMRAYFRDQGMPGHDSRKGKQRKSLPPGIARNLQRGKPLPPGIAKQALPPRLVQVLPAVPRGYERIIVSGKVLLVHVATQVIHDVLEDVILD